jgi:hypothetical protein
LDGGFIAILQIAHSLIDELNSPPEFLFLFLQFLQNLAFKSQKLHLELSNDIVVALPEVGSFATELFEFKVNGLLGAEERFAEEIAFSLY